MDKSDLSVSGDNFYVDKFLLKKAPPHGGAFEIRSFSSKLLLINKSEKGRQVLRQTLHSSGAPFFL